MSGGILFGPWVGITTGVIAGVHRYLIDMDGVTAVPCLITSIIAGIASGVINRRVGKEQRWRAGILGGMLCETFTMLLIVLLVQSVEGEKEAIAARQAKLALEIPNKTLPLFRQVNSQSLRQVCDIIRSDIHADAVAITNTKQILAYLGYGEHNYQNGDDGISPTTEQSIASGKIIIKNNDEEHRINGSLKDYIAIEQARFGDKLSMICGIDEDLHFSLPSLLIQPLVENAIVPQRVVYTM